MDAIFVCQQELGSLDANVRASGDLRHQLIFRNFRESTGLPWTCQALAILLLST